MSHNTTSTVKKDHLPMTIWIDADAAPRDVKEIVFRASARLQVQVRLVANQSIGVPNAGGRIQSIAVPHGANVADRYIVENSIANDLAITADIPLAAVLVDKGVHVIEPRGDVLDANNVKSRLASRDLLDAARGSGMEISGPSPYNLKDKAAFASALDRMLTKLTRRRAD
jgi:uncharacterized protein YaiI (UPF0178 family)